MLVSTTLCLNKVRFFLEYSFVCKERTQETRLEMTLESRVSQFFFVEFRFGGRITGANGCPEATKNFQRYRPINDT